MMTSENEALDAAEIAAVARIVAAKAKHRGAAFRGLQSVALEILTSVHGNAGAAELLRDLADAMESDGGFPRGGVQ